MNHDTHTYTSFAGHRRIASGPLLANVLAVRRALDSATEGQVLVLEDATGRVVDVDTRGTDTDIAERLATPALNNDAPAAEARGRGRPRLGVVPREVTLLPRHWEWLAEQPGGASVVLRKLVEEARRAGQAKHRQRLAQERAYRFLSAVAGDLPGFEEVTRALFANDSPRMEALTAAWPPDVRAYALQLAACDSEVPTVETP